MTYTTDQVALRVRDANRALTMGTDRSQQQAEHRIGASDIGQCREYVRRMVVGTPYDDDAEDDKWAAFVGTALGDRTEAAYLATYVNSGPHGEEHPSVMTQVDLTTTLPSGRIIQGHADILDQGMDCMIDLKSKDGLSVIRTAAAKGEIDRNHLFQVRLYRRGAIQAGLLTENSRAFLVYQDRSGGDALPVVVEVSCTPDDEAQIDLWIDDVEYAVRTGEEAPKDRPYNWCQVACSFFGSCRGHEVLEDGLLEGEHVAIAAKTYLDGQALKKQGETMMKDAKVVLEKYPDGGFIPAVGKTLSFTHINGYEVQARTQAPYSKIGFRTAKPTPQPKEPQE